MADPRFDGRRILVAEDELLLALDLCDMLQVVGCDVVGPARTLAKAIALAQDSATLDLAILDLNLAGDMSLPLAADLMNRGVPVILTTGYEARDLPSDLPAIAICVKPLSRPALLRTLHSVFGG